MKLTMSADEIRAFLEGNEDAEEVAPGEYVIDLYDVSTPLSLDIALDDGVEALAALRLLYSEEEDGWYLGEAVEDRELIEKLLREAME